MSTTKEGRIQIKNAGIVLLNSYIPLFFERINLQNEHAFINKETQLDAVHFLQNLVTGHTHTDEYELPLNKILCGLPISTPIKEGVEISEDQKNIVTGLLNAFIAYWPAIGNSSIKGLRENWLIRDGLLTEKEDRWELIVEKRAYDLLIHKSPFSFSIIKYPWMSKPIHVIWV